MTNVNACIDGSQSQNRSSVAGLRESRVRYRDEMRRAISCATAEQKRRLVADWKRKYSDLMVRELVSLAKVSEIRDRVSQWEQ